MIAQAFSVATIAVKPSARGRSMAVVATLGALGAVSGPTAGGYLTQAAGWPWIFFLNIPICLVLVVTFWNQAPADRPAPCSLPGRRLGDGDSRGCRRGDRLEPVPQRRPRARVATSAVLAVPFLALWKRLPASQTVIDLTRRPTCSPFTWRCSPSSPASCSSCSSYRSTCNASCTSRLRPLVSLCWPYRRRRWRWARSPASSPTGGEHGLRHWPGSAHSSPGQPCFCRSTRTGPLPTWPGGWR